MKTEHLDELRPYQLRKELSNLGVELTNDQYSILSNCGRTFLYTHRIKEKKSKAIYRITYPFFLIWNVLITFIVQPLKWLCTGNFYFSTDNKLYKFTINWSRKIGL